MAARGGEGVPHVTNALEDPIFEWRSYLCIDKNVSSAKDTGLNVPRHHEAVTDIVLITIRLGEMGKFEDT